MTPEWITTGEAARMLGYTPQHFIRKFEGLLPSRRVDGGYRKWLRAAVEEVARCPMPLAG